MFESAKSVEDRSVNLPSLVHNFDHSRIDKVNIGPRRECTLYVALLVWDGPNGRYVEGVQVRFGGIENFDTAVEFFGAAPEQQSELAWLKYATDRRSKPGQLFFDLVFERIEAQLRIECSSLNVSGPIVN
jgi:hypothetical protein